MRGGRLRKQVVIETVTPSQGATGEITNAWSTFATVRAELITQTAKESLTSDQILGIQYTIFRIRYLAGITTKMRVLYDSRYFDIESSVNLFERDREINLYCKEIL